MPNDCIGILQFRLKKYHSKKWIKQEKLEGSFISNLIGIYGLFQEVTDNSLKEVEGLEFVD